MTAMPRSLQAATRLLERYAELEGSLAAVEAQRSEEIASANAAADQDAAPLIKELGGIRAALEPWFAAAGKPLLPKGRKSMELGGCMIGSRSSRPSLVISGEEQDVVAVLSGLRWAKPMLRVKTSLNRSAVMSSLDGKHRVALAELGISRSEGDERFFVERVEQAGTRQPG